MAVVVMAMMVVMVQGISAALPSSATLARSLVYMKRWRSIFALGGIHALLDIRCKAVEGLLNVDVVLCRHLQEGDAKLIRQLLALLGGNSPLLLPVTLVSNQNLVDPLTRVLLDV